MLEQSNRSKEAAHVPAAVSSKRRRVRIIGPHRNGGTKQPPVFVVEEFQFTFGPENPVKPDKELFLAEYNSLRSEILQRINQLTVLTQIALTAWGTILAYALPKSEVRIVLIYPVLAYFITFGWAFNNARIFQIAKYLMCREKEVVNKHWGLMFWENHINSKPKFDNARIKPGLAVFPGSQVASLLIAVIIWATEVRVDKKPDVLTFVLFGIGLIITGLTWRNIWASEQEPTIKGMQERQNSTQAAQIEPAAE